MNRCICAGASQKNAPGLDVKNSKSTKRVEKPKYNQHPWFWLPVNSEVLNVKKTNKNSPKFMVNFGLNRNIKKSITPMIELVSRLVKELLASLWKNNYYPQGGRL
jgi:hypothetical protein